MSSVDATASGLPYRVVTVNGELPTSLEQFAGEVSFTVSKSGTESSVAGVGTVHESAVRFQEKELSVSKDVRVWQIRQSAEGTYTAETISQF
jgi:hypothetical protein